MKVLFINSPTKTYPVVRDMAGGLGLDGAQSIVLPPLDLAYMAATLLNNGHETKIIDSNVEGYQADDIYQIVNEFKPDSIVATVSLPTIYQDCSFLKNIKDLFGVKVLAKTNINYEPILKEILEKSFADLCIYGECETIIDKIILAEEKKGTAYFENGKLCVEENKIIANLDELPLPARNLLPNGKYYFCFLGDNIATIQTSRGCPYSCSYYCPYPLVQGKKWRARSAEHVIREIDDIVSNHKIKRILFRDAAFTLDKNRVSRICDLIIEKKLNVTWWAETRVDCLDSELMERMKKAGCLGLNIGVETGDPEVMETQAKIGLTLEKIKTIRKEAQNIGLKVHFLLMIGLPKETKKSLYETYKLVCNLKPETIGVSIVTPYPGTQLYQEAKEKGWIETGDWSEFTGNCPVMHTDYLSSSDLSKAQRMLNQGFYYLSNKGSIKNWIKSKIWNYYFRRWVYH